MSKNLTAINDILQDPVKVAGFILSQVNLRSVYNIDEFVQTSQHKGSVSIICQSILCDEKAAIINSSVNLIKDAFYSVGNNKLDIIHDKGTVYISLNDAKDLHAAFPIKAILIAIQSAHKENSQRKLTEEAMNKLMSSVSNVSAPIGDLHASVVNTCSTKFVDQVEHNKDILSR